MLLFLVFDVRISKQEYRKFCGILTLPINALTSACTPARFSVPLAINAIAKNARHREPIAAGFCGIQTLVSSADQDLDRREEQVNRPLVGGCIRLECGCRCG